MHSLSSVSRDKNFKSRIPVPIKNQKVSILSNTEKRCDKKASTLQSASANKATNSDLQNEQRKCVLQPQNLSDRTIRDSKFKNNRQSSLKTNIKNDTKREKQLPHKINIKSSDNKTSVTLRSNINNVHKTTQKSFKANIKSINNKKENVPLLKTDMKTNGDGVEKMLTPKKHKITSKQDCFSAQKDIKFEANEFYRNMILSGRELSPSIIKLMPSVRLSAVQTERPSAYQKFEVPSDPSKEALKAVENARFSFNRVRNVSVKENKRNLSPYKDRGSFYTPRADPKWEVMKSLEEFKLRQQQKIISRSTKKVTFNLDVKECLPKNVCDKVPNLKDSECGLTQISEKSEENTPNSPQSKRTESFALKQDHGSILTSESDKKHDNCVEYQERKTACETDNAQKDCIKMKKCENSSLEMPFTKSLTMDPEKVTFIQHRETLLKYSKKIDSLTSSPNLSCANNKVLREESANCKKSVNSINIRSIKVCTPRPVSFSCKSELTDSASPEFFVNRRSEILTELAPIYTPLVLKSISKHNMFSPEADLSPVRLKLEFTEKDTPRKAPSKNQTFASKNIVTIQKKLDDLADQECYLLLLNESIPIVCGRYLTNPVALTLSEGDDMHFIPVQL